MNAIYGIAPPRWLFKSDAHFLSQTARNVGETKYRDTILADRTEEQALRNNRALASFIAGRQPGKAAA